MKMDQVTTPRMLERPITDARAWVGRDLTPADWTITLPAEALAELRQVLKNLRHSPLETLLLDPRDFALDACRATMEKLRTQLTSGIMFAVLDRLPVEEMSHSEATQLYWLLASLVARPVAQKLNGQMFFDVRDTGAKLKPGSGIRPTVTNVDLTYHNDNSYNDTPPDVVTLLCIHHAMQGGVSRVVSVYSVHNALRADYPDLLPRLYRPFWYDRHAEHLPDEPNAFSAPVFEYTDVLNTRLALSEIYAGYALKGDDMDATTRDALAAVQSVFNRPDMRVELEMRAGQIQFVNNRATGHARTEFQDYPEPERKRHLVRLWLRDAGLRSYRG
jgi:alpha-ketoglutarate-dependent taurine dioxygenase